MNSSDKTDTDDLTEKIVSVAVPRPLYRLFTYRLPSKFVPLVEIGSCVKVPFGRSLTHAFVVDQPKLLSEMPAGLTLDQLKAVAEVSESGSVFTPDVLSLCRWAHEYYCAPLGEVLNCAIPSQMVSIKGAGNKLKRKSRPIPSPQASSFRHSLTKEQEQVFQNLDQLRKQGSGKVALLHGVTGSGKTEIYIELAKKTLSEGKNVLILVPEIALTPQLHQRIERGLGVTIGLWHSALSAGKRRDYNAALRSGEMRVVVGARSAVFAPVLNLGLIVVDEEHDPTYKQEDRVRYHARDLAVVRAKLTNSFVLLGSATPSLETRERVRENRYSVEKLMHRIASGGLPQTRIIDLRTESRIEKIQTPLARSTVEAIQNAVHAGEQVMIYLNRRGFAAFLLCKDCGTVKRCPHCSVSLTVYKTKSGLRCHLCGHKEPIPKVCFKCQGVHLFAMGSGTESLEREITQLIRGSKVSRLDRDQVTSVKRLESILDDFRQGRSNILLGTQMLVKGHDFPGVTLVVVVLADSLFRWPDFRASERAFQVLTQVSGRAGRGEKAGQVLIQAYDLEHPVLQVIQGVTTEEDFLEGERELRRALGYPPWGRLARVRFECSTREEAINRSTAVADEIQKLLKIEWPEGANFSQSSIPGNLEILGPSEAFLEKIKNTYRWDILLKAKNIQNLQKALNMARDLCLKNKWQFLPDIDPYGV
jgi:primosomal protein N' (replication factor Y) (superfamily II helicase)